MVCRWFAAPAILYPLPMPPPSFALLRRDSLAVTVDGILAPARKMVHGAGGGISATPHARKR